MCHSKNPAIFAEKLQQLPTNTTKRVTLQPEQATMRKYLLFIAFISCHVSFKAIADPKRDSTKTKKVLLPVRRSYIGSGMDGAILSFADAQKGGASISSPPRFTWFFNWGATFNLNITRHLGVYTGVDVKNMGFIENVNGITTKRRTYNVGVPVGIKIGNMALKQPYAFLGGGIDIPVNYKEKAFSVRNQKTKFNEYFSERTPQIMPYAFVGVAVNRGVTLKLQYYPENFLNTEFAKAGVKPYANYDVHILMLSLGMSVPAKRYHPGMRLIGDKKEQADAKAKNGESL